MQKLIGIASGPEALGIYDFSNIGFELWESALIERGFAVRRIDLSNPDDLLELWNCHGLLILSDGAYFEIAGALSLTVIFEWCRRGGALACIGGSPFLLASRSSGFQSQVRAAIDISELLIGYNAAEVALRSTLLAEQVLRGIAIPKTLIELNRGSSRLLTLHAIAFASENLIESELGDPVLASYQLGQGWLVNWAAAVQVTFLELILEGTLRLLVPHIPDRPPQKPTVIIDRSALAISPLHDTVCALLTNHSVGELKLVDADTSTILDSASPTSKIVTFTVPYLEEPREILLSTENGDLLETAVVSPPIRPPLINSILLQEPKDFDKFWAAALLELDQIPLKYQLTPLHELSSSSVTVLRVKFTSADYVTITGVLSMPVNRDSSTPRILSLPGYAVGGLENHPWPLASRAVILSIDVRRVGSIEGSLQYDGEGILTHRLDSPSRSGIRGAILDATRAFDILSRIAGKSKMPPAVIGASQGGALALAVGALRPQARAIVSAAPFLMNIVGCFEVVNTEPYRELQRFIQKYPESRTSALSTLAFVDGAYFLSRIASPCLLVTSPEDEIAPSSHISSLIHGRENIEILNCNGGHIAVALVATRLEAQKWLLSKLSQNPRRTPGMISN